MTRLDGEKIFTTPSGAKIYKLPNGVVTIDSSAENGSFSFDRDAENPLKNPEGWQILTLDSGEEIIKSPSGTLFTTNNGSSVMNDDQSEIATEQGHSVSATTPGWKSWQPVEQQKALTKANQFTAFNSFANISRDFSEFQAEEYVKYFAYKIACLELKLLQIKLRNHQKIQAIYEEVRQAEAQLKDEQVKQKIAKEIDELKLQIEEKTEEILLNEKKIKIFISEQLEVCKNKYEEDLELQIQFLHSQIAAINKLNFYIPTGSAQLKKILEEVINTFPEIFRSELMQALVGVNLQIQNQSDLEQQLTNLKEILAMPKEEQKKENQKEEIKEVVEKNQKTKEVHATPIVEEVDSEEEATKTHKGATTSSKVSSRQQYSDDTTHAIVDLSESAAKVGTAYYGYQAATKMAAAQAKKSDDQVKQTAINAHVRKKEIETEREKFIIEQEQQKEELALKKTESKEKYNLKNKELNNAHDTNIKKLEIDKQVASLELKLEKFQNENEGLRARVAELEKKLAEETNKRKEKKQAFKEKSKNLKQENKTLKEENGQLKLSQYIAQKGSAYSSPKKGSDSPETGESSLAEYRKGR